MIEGISKQTIENFNRMSENRKIVLVGLVNENVKKAMSLFDNIECIIDGDTERCGLRQEGLPIYSYEHLYALSPDTHIILVTARTGGVYSVTNAVKEIDTFNIFYLNVIADKFFGFFSNELYDNYDKIRKIEAVLYDDRSKKIYREVVRRRVIGATGEYNKLKTRIDPQYLYQDMYKNK